MSVGNLKDKIEGNEIDLSLCNLTDVPVTELADIPEATHLDLSCNFFTSLPDSFCLLTHLVKIDLSKNKLIALPEDFGQLVHLEHLDLMGNDLVTLPASFCQLYSLQWLDLKGNPLDPALRETTGDCLDEKQCRECAQKVLQYMRGTTPETEKDDEKRKSRVWVPEWLPKLPAMIILGLALAVGTLYYGGSSMKRWLCAGTMNPICTHLRNIALRMAEYASHVWHAISNAVL